jgi:hypothetical protein
VSEKGSGYILAFVLFLAAGIAGFSAYLILGPSMRGALGWIAAAQACCILVVWPAMHKRFNYATAPAVLLLLSAPLYVAGVLWGGSSSVETALSLVLLYMLFVYVSLLMTLEEARGIPPAAWYVPVSVLLVGGPVLIHYVLAEYLGRPLPWLAGISPMVALSDTRFLSTACGAWVAVLAVMGIAAVLMGRTEGKNEGQ